ncbi:MAG: type IV pilin protein [Bacteroidia bacterium]
MKIRKRIKRFARRKISGVTLPELMVVLAIMGILAALSLPKLLPLISKTKTLEAQEQLKYVSSLEKMNFYIESKYSSDLKKIGFEQAKTVKEGGQANYDISISEADNRGFVAIATAVTDFDADGILNIWQIDQEGVLKEVTPD